MPPLTKSWLEEGIREHKAGNYSEAINYFNQQIRYDVRDVEAWFYKGESWFSRGKYDEAIACFDKVLEIQPSHEDAWRKKGATLVRQGKMNEALELFSLASESVGDLPGFWLEKSKVLFEMNQMEQARESVEHALELEPGLGESWLIKGRILDKSGMFEEAVMCYTRATKMNKKLSLAWLLKGNALMELGRYKEAIRCYDWTTRLMVDSVEAWYKKGDALFIMGKTKRALESFEKVLELEPEHKDAIYRVGQVYEEMGDIKVALQYYSLTDKGEGRGKTLATKADAYFRMDELDEALKAYDAALEANPYNFQAWLGKSKVLVIKEKFLEAIESLNQAIKFEGGNPEVYLLKANAFFHLHKYGEALQTFDQALGLIEVADDERRIPILLDKGTALMALGRKEDSLELLNEVAQMDANNRKAKEFLSIIEGAGKYGLDTRNKTSLYHDALKSLEIYRTNLFLAESMKMKLPVFQESYYHAVGEMKNLNFLTVLGIVKTNIRRMEDEFTRRISEYFREIREMIVNLDVSVDTTNVLLMLERADNNLTEKKFKDAFDYVETILEEVNSLQNLSKRMVAIRQQDPRYLEESRVIQSAVNDMIKEAERNNLDAGHIKELVQKANISRYNKNYMEAVNILKDAKKYVRSLLITLSLDSSMEDLENDTKKAIEKAEETLEGLRVFGYEYPEAKKNIKRAREKLEEGSFTESYVDAKKSLNVIPKINLLEEFLVLYEEGTDLLKKISKFKSFPTKVVADQLKEARENMEKRRVEKATTILRENIPEISSALKNKALVVKLRVVQQKVAKLKKLGLRTGDIEEMVERSKQPMLDRKYDEAIVYVDKALSVSNKRLSAS